MSALVDLGRHSFCWIFATLLKQEAEGGLAAPTGKASDGRILSGRETSIIAMRLSVENSVKNSNGRIVQTTVKNSFLTICAEIHRSSATFPSRNSLVPRTTRRSGWSPGRRREKPVGQRRGASGLRLRTRFTLVRELCGWRGSLNVARQPRQRASSASTTDARHATAFVRKIVAAPTSEDDAAKGLNAAGSARSGRD